MTRSVAIAGLADAISKNTKEKILLVPAARLAALRDSLSNVVQQTANFNEQLGGFVKTGGIVSADDEIATGANGSTVQVRQLLNNIWNTQDSALEARLAISSAISPRALGGFSAASKVLTEKAAEAGELLERLRADSAVLAATVSTVSAQATEAASASQEVGRLQGEIETRRRTIDENASAISAALATVNELSARAAVLEAQVSEFEPKLSAFDESITSRETSHAATMSKLAAATSSLTLTETALKEITQQAKDVLGEATVAGLSKEYANQATTVDGQLTKSRHAYYISVGLLVLSVMMALGLLPSWAASPMKPIPEWTFGTPTGAYVVQLLGALGSRILVILPAGLLAAFASTRHSALFRLREEYNHKKGLAASIDGFKAQAPDYAEAMAAAVFQELVKNPALAIDGKADHSPNGYLAKILEPRVREALAAMVASGGVLAAEKGEAKA